jgi:hypothetical protein
MIRTQSQAVTFEGVIDINRQFTWLGAVNVNAIERYIPKACSRDPPLCLSFFLAIPRTFTHGVGLATNEAILP